MKTSFKIYGMLLLLFISAGTHADEKSKKVTQNYTVTGSTLIEIDNRFGKVHINTWDKDEVHVNVEIIASGANPDRILDKINIRFDERISGNYLGIFTELKELGEKKSSFEINYTVDLPKSNELKLRNKFGDTYITDMDGEVELDIQYGNLKAGSFNKALNLNLEFGSAMSNISYAKNGNINIKYSKLTIDKAGSLAIDSQFSDFFATNLGNARLQMKYGKFATDRIGKISGSQSYSEFRANYLLNSVELEVKHNQITIENIDKAVGDIRIDGQYSSITLGLENGYAGTFVMNFQYSDLKHNGGNITFNKRIRETTKSFYEGFIGKPQSSSTMVINSKYGDLKLSIAE